MSRGQLIGFVGALALTYTVEHWLPAWFLLSYFILALFVIAVVIPMTDPDET